ncbi:MAG: acetate--CoA ligase, partial [Gammaproteobacteria bacterium]|nr:acetate--CoA ligase [Gammaproteobacteria bacterium]
MSENLYPVPEDFAANAHVNAEQYEAMYKQSVEDPETFWAQQADDYLDWFEKWDSVLDWSYDKDDLHINWFKGGKLNVSHNCLDKHLDTRGDQTAIIWEGDDPAEDKKITYRELHTDVCKLANVLKDRGVKKGDRVSIYMPMIPEAVVAMLACTRIGAVHSIVFSAFSPDALKDRINDSDCQTLITADQSIRSGKALPLKANADKALANCPNVHTSIVVKRGGEPVEWTEGRDVWYHEAIADASAECAPEPMDAEDPLFILYTSGSTGKPKGVLHTTGGYLLQAAMTHKLVFDYKEGEVYWCTADIGWITGHSYIVYGPLNNGAISLMFEGVPTYPDAGRFWQVVDKHNVATFYTAPTAIRALMAVGDDPVTSTSRKSLRLLGTVGEPINPEAWNWYNNVVGDGRCPIVDTWWQTETG